MSKKCKMKGEIAREKKKRSHKIRVSRLGLTLFTLSHYYSNNKMTQYTTSKKEEIAKVYTPENCKVFEMVQYQCEANRTNIECTPFVRLFLR